MEQPAAAVGNIGQAVLVAVAGVLTGILAFIPNLIGALIILLVGWLIASVVDRVVTRALRVVRFNDLADRAEIDQFLTNAGVRMDASAVVGRIVYWFLLLIFLVAASNTLGLPQVSALLSQLIAFIPNLIVALIVLLLGALVANFVANLVRGSTAAVRVGDPNLLATIARSAIMVFALLMALDQINIAPTIIDTLWTATIGMVAVAGALAFGLGGRDLAGRLLNDWYNKGRTKTRELQDEAERTRYASSYREPAATAPRAPERPVATEHRAA